jgi:hypothetical protein
MSLPSWAVPNEKGVIVVDRDAAYPEIMAALKIKAKDLDQHTVEIIYQCTKLEVMRCIVGTKADPRPAKSLVISMEGKDKDRWALKKFPLGLGADAATAGGAARRAYIAWRGFVPA